MNCNCGGTLIDRHDSFGHLDAGEHWFECLRCKREYRDPVACELCGRVYEKAEAVARSFCSAACADDADDASTVWKGNAA